MPSRKFPLVTNQTYHVFNRGIDGRATFTGKREYDRMVNLINYYRFDSPPIRFSHFTSLPENLKNKTINNLSKRQHLIKIISYCLMPNHYHLLVEQLVDNGISIFISNIQNSYTRYFNTKNKRVGQLFLGQFKTSLIESEATFLHVSRYIHLNPYSSCLVNSFDKLISYEWSSLAEYLYLKPDEKRICDRKDILAKFPRISSYEKFLFDQKDYQRKLKALKHLMFE